MSSEKIKANYATVDDNSAAARAQSVPWWKHEDWLAVIVGLFLIFAVLIGARVAAPKYAWARAGDLSSAVFGAGNLTSVAFVGVSFLLVSAAGAALLGWDVRRYALGFPAVFALSVVAQVIAGNAGVSYWGVEYVIFAVLIGMLIGNTVGTPAWLAEAVRTEYYIKIGLVILGASILVQEVLQAGALGLAQALGVVIVVWYACYWLAKKLRLDDEFAVMLSSAVSICGVSAAIAACGAIKGDRRKLSYVTSLVLLVAIPMIVLQPWAVKAFGIPDVVGGAWLGGTLDTTGSVAAAGSLISEAALKVGTIVKFSQNVLIGVAAFLISVWWAMKSKNRDSPEDRPSLAMIWERFPKFVLGFVATSIIFSFLLDPALVGATKGLLTSLRTAWFALAFVSIGLETRLADLVKMEGGRPALTFVIAQAVNVVWTLLLAYLFFGGLIFPPPAIK